jgi:hypothetical protein
MRQMRTVLLRILLWAGSAFYLSEFVIHFFGLPVLEHDKIFLPTHDRYIALYALTYAALLALIALDPVRYATLFVVVMAGIALGFANASWIAASGGYRKSFSVRLLDDEIRKLGLAVAAWYVLTWTAWWRQRKRMMP